MLIFFIVGGAFKGSTKKLKENCTEITTGIVTDYESKKQKDSDGNYDTYYYPIYIYCNIFTHIFQVECTCCLNFKNPHNT